MPKKNTPTLEEMIEEIGQSDETKGIASVNKFMKMFEKQQWEMDQFKKGRLEKVARYTKEEYYKALYDLLVSEIPDLDLPDGFGAWGEVTRKGLVLRLADAATGKTYHGAFKPSGTPKKDYGAIVELLGRAIDTAININDVAFNRARAKGLILPT